MVQFVLEFHRAQSAGDPFAFRIGHQEYIRRTDGGGAKTAVLDWDDGLLADLASVQRPSCDPAVVQRLGDRIAGFLQQADWTPEARSIGAAVARGESVVLTLRLSAAELYALPWELLTLQTSGQCLGALPGLLLRYCWPETNTIAEEPETRPEGGRILLAWSAAGGAVPASEHAAAIRSAYRRGHLPIELNFDVLPNVSVASLAACLEASNRDNKPIAVLHILCHGTRHGATFGLSWQSERGESELVDGAQLTRVLQPHAGQLRLVVLCACDSGNSGELGNHLGSIALALHRAGIQAIVASRYPLSVEGSVHLTEELYGALLSGPTSLESALEKTRQRLVRSGLDWAGMQLYARPADGADTRPVVMRPYRGLLAFETSHTRFFFGRENERQQTLKKLHALADSPAPRFLIVAGASGTGKSSLVLAGVIPDLVQSSEQAATADSEAWPRVLRQLTGLLQDRACSPAAKHALETLQREAVAERHAGKVWEVVAFRPGADPLGSLSMALEARKKPTNSFLLVVDQFEEVFTHTRDTRLREVFTQRLWALSRANNGVFCIITVRVDFLGQCGQLVVDESGLRLDRVAYEDAHRVFVAQLGIEQLRSAIEGPARLLGLQLQEGLSTRIITEVGAEPGALPLVEYTLDLLWQRRRGRLLTAESYATLGGVVGALQQKADSLVAGLRTEQQEQARRLLVRLVGIGDNGAADTRMRVPVEQLRRREASRVQQATFDQVLASFVNARLLVLTEEGGQGVLEVAHEALIRKWRLLQQWVDEDRMKLRELKELERWVEQRRSFGTLLKGEQLGYAAQVLEKYGDDIEPHGRELIAASRRAEQEERQRELEQSRQREEAAQRLAEEADARRQVQEQAASDARLAARRQRRRSQVAAVLGILATVAAGFSTSFYMQEQKLYRAAKSRFLATRAIQNLSERPDLALLLAVAAMRYADTSEARSSLLTALRQPGERSARLLHGSTKEIRGLGFVDDARTLVAFDHDGTKFQYNLASGSLTSKVPLAQEAARDPLERVFPASDGNTLALVRRSPDVGGQLPRFSVALELPGRAASPIVPASLPFNPTAWTWSHSGKTLAIAGLGGVHLLDRDSGMLREAFAGDEIEALAFCADDRCLVSSHANGSIQVWDLEGRVPPKILQRGTEESPIRVLALAVSAPQAHYLVASDNGGRLQLFTAKEGAFSASAMQLSASEPETGAASPRVEPQTFPLLAFSKDGERLAVGSDRGTVLLFATRTGKQEGPPLKLHPASISALAFSPDDRALISADRRGGVVVWDLTETEPRVLFPGFADVNADNVDRISFSRQLDRVAFTLLSDLKRAHVRTTKVDGPVERAITASADLTSIDLSPSGQLLATASASDGAVQLWDAESGGKLGAPLMFDARAGIKELQVGFSPDSRRLGAAANSGWQSWDLSSRRAFPFLETNRAAQASVAPDGNKVVIPDPSDGKPVSWDLISGLPTSERFLGFGERRATATWFSSDGKRLAATDTTGAILVWDTATRQPLSSELGGGGNDISNLIFVLNNQMLATIRSNQNIVQLWDIRTGAQIGPDLPTFSARPSFLLAGPDGKSMILGDYQGKLLRWNLDPENWQRQACRTANRNLSSEEWKNVVGGEGENVSVCPGPSPG